MTLTPTQDAAVPPAAATPLGRRLSRDLAGYATVLGMALVVIGIGVARHNYLSASNLQTVLVDVTVLVVLAVGLCLVMSMRGIDLSIAATADLAGYLAALLLLQGSGLLTAVIAALAVGLTVGLINGALAGYLGVPAIVATLGLNLLLTAVASSVSDNGTPQQLFTSSDDVVRRFLQLGSGSLGPLRHLVLVASVVVLIAWFTSRHTIWGRQIDLVEASARAAFLAGIPVRATFAAGFIASGFLAALGGLMLTARTGVVVPGNAQPLLLSAFTAVYLGSVASPKGRITVLWTVLGALFVSLLANGLTLLGLGAAWRIGLNGLLILLALALGTLRRRVHRA